MLKNANYSRLCLRVKMLLLIEERCRWPLYLPNSLIQQKRRFRLEYCYCPYKKSTWIHTCDFMWNHVITSEMMWSYVKFNMWKNFTSNHMWNFTNERISQEITCDISHVKRFHMKSHMTFHMWKDFTWNHMWHFTCERISHEIACDISHVKGFHMKSHVTFHMWKYFTWNYRWNFTCERSSVKL
jgi:hypothetical protein